MVEQKYLQNARGFSNLLNALSNIGVNRDSYFSGFVADHRIMDQLRLNCSALSPGSNDSMSNLGLAIVGALEEHYGSFIPESTLEDSVGIVDRLLCVPSNEYEVFRSAWRSSPGSRKDQSAGQFFRYNGRIIVFRSPDYVVARIDSDLTKEQINQFGGRKEVYIKVVAAYFGNILAHEIAHEYHGQSFSRHFEESGAEYYAQHLSKLMGLPYGYLAGYGELPKAFYAQLIEKYGDDVHRTFFGSPLENYTQQMILDEFTPTKITELFPTLEEN